MTSAHPILIFEDYAALRDTLVEQIAMNSELTVDVAVLPDVFRDPEAGAND